ncbi:hypothetical protein, partial [Klebsiella pneumoniae]|uniref:hypothetical protein n=1 Tax=Klebsiella pneumoniae TaxID=573 RepID=UPI001C6FACCE
TEEATFLENQSSLTEQCIVEVRFEDPECFQKQEIYNVHLEHVTDHMQWHVYSYGRDETTCITHVAKEGLDAANTSVTPASLRK